MTDRIDAESPYEVEPLPESNPAVRGRILVIVATLTLVALPLLWSIVPVEVSRWYEAAAQEALRADDLQRAESSLNRAIDWNPHNADLLALRSAIRLQAKDVEGALADCEAALKLDPRGSDFIFNQRALAYQRRGDVDQMLADLDRVVAIAAAGPQADPESELGRNVSFHYDEALNNRAYQRALVGRELNAALKDIEEALQRAGEPQPSTYLDTRGYLKFLLQDLDGAAADMQQAIESFESERKKWLAATTDPAQTKLIERETQQALAVMYQHRGLIAKAQGRTAEAEADLAKAKEYGYSPEDGIW